MEIWSVDRIEEDTVVLINAEKKVIDASIALFPKSIASGDIVVQQANGEFLVDFEKTAERKRSLFNLQKKIFGDS